MLARLFILAGHPRNGRNRGEHVLTCMQALCSNLKEELVELWDMVVPKLLSYLLGNAIMKLTCRLSIFIVAQSKERRGLGTRNIGKILC